MAIDALGFVTAGALVLSGAAILGMLGAIIFGS